MQGGVTSIIGTCCDFVYPGIGQGGQGQLISFRLSSSRLPDVEPAELGKRDNGCGNNHMGF
jgi:hypothetical protein